ncbi:hypothetical protein N499_0535A, partial [Wolbachia pipientis wVitA]
MNGYNLDSS